MILVSEYNLSDGRINLNLTFSDEATFELNQKEGFGYFDGHHDGAVFYVKDSGLTYRPIFTATPDKFTLAADGVEALTVTGLPSGKTGIRLIGPIEDKWDETRKKTDLTVNVPGHYRLWMSQWPYQDQWVEFDAT